MKQVTSAVLLLIATSILSLAEYEVRVENGERVLVSSIDGKNEVIRRLNDVPMLKTQAAQVHGSVTTDAGYEFVLYSCGNFVLLEKIHKNKVIWDNPVLITNKGSGFTRFEISVEADDAYVSGYMGSRLAFKASCLHSQLIFKDFKKPAIQPGVPLPEGIPIN